MSPTATQARTMRIGELAREVGTTPRTIRYYEEIGLLPGSTGRPSGGHRAYTGADLERLRELMRLKDLLGVSLDELGELAEAEEALGHIDRQLELVRRRKGELETLEGELTARRRRVRRRLGA